MESRTMLKCEGCGASAYENEMHRAPGYELMPMQPIKFCFTCYMKRKNDEADRVARRNARKGAYKGYTPL